MISLTDLRSQKGEFGLCSKGKYRIVSNSGWTRISFSLILLLFSMWATTVYARQSRALDADCIVRVGTTGLASAPVADPNITVRCANPTFNCPVFSEFCLDVQFQSDIANKELFGMNVRFFYDDNVLEFVAFRDFQGGYSASPPNPPTITTSASGGPALFNFAGPFEYIQGAVSKTNTNAPPIYISTTDWTKLYQVCFTVEHAYINSTNFWPSFVWDLESNPANGGFPNGSDGVVMTVVNGSQSAPVSEHVQQFNWQYTGNGSPPYGQPVQLITSNINCGACNFVVSSTADAGTGSLREALVCAQSGDTISFATSLAGATINITSTRLVINKNLFIRSNLNPRLKINSSIAGLIEMGNYKTVEFKDIDFTSGTTMPNNDGAAFKNSGIIKFVSCKVFRNPSLPAGQYLIKNLTGSQIAMSGACFIQN